MGEKAKRKVWFQRLELSQMRILFFSGDARLQSCGVLYSTGALAAPHRNAKCLSPGKSPGGILIGALLRATSISLVCYSVIVCITPHFGSAILLYMTAKISQNYWKRLLSFYLQGLNQQGVTLIASRLLDSTLRLPGSEPFRDVLSEGGFASQRGMDIWRMAGVVLLLFRAILASDRALVRGR